MFYCFVVLTISIIVLPACMSSGSLLGNTTKSDRNKESTEKTDSSASEENATGDTGAGDQEEDEPEEEEPVNELYISTTPEGARIYINNGLEGYSSLTLEDPVPGEYKITVKKEGFYPETRWITYYEGYKEVEIELEQIKGYLEIETNVPRFTAHAGSYSTSQQRTRLPIGEYAVTIISFGYIEYTTRVEIKEDLTTTLKAVLVEAVFEASNLHLSRRVFNPANPGAMGQMTIKFDVTGFGSGELKLTGSGGTEIPVGSFGEFITWKQKFIWKGEGAGGEDVPDGDYLMQLTVTGSREGKTIILEKKIKIDSTFIINFRHIWSGVSGLMYAPSPGTLPFPGIQVTTFLMSAMEQAEEPILRAPGQIGVRVGLPLDFEGVINFSSITTNYESYPIFLGISMKKRITLFRGPVSLETALSVKGTYHYGTNADTYSNTTGLTLGLPVSLKVGLFAFLLTPEVILSPYRVIYGSDETQSPAFYSWLYARGGFFMDTGSIVTGLSCSIRTFPFAEGFAMDLPFNGALELHLLIPGTAVYISGAIAGEFSAIDNFYTMAGVGVSFLY